MSQPDTVQQQTSAPRKSQSIGQFAPVAALVPGDSFLHRLHPAPKLVWTFTTITFVFLVRNVFLLFALALLVVLLAALSGLWKEFWRAYRVLLPVLLSVIFVQAVASAPLRPRNPIAEIGPVVIYQEGIHNGIALFARIFVTMGFSQLVIFTTHTADIFYLLQRLAVPYELSFMTLTTVQLIPIFQMEFMNVMRAQQSRGLPARGFRALLPSIVPVFAGSMERVMQLAMSLESRGFGSSGKKTNLRETRARPIDYLLSTLGILALIGTVVLVIVVGTLDTSQLIVIPSTPSVIIFVGSFVVFVIMLGRNFIPSRS